MVQLNDRPVRAAISAGRYEQQSASGSFFFFFLDPNENVRSAYRLMFSLCIPRDSRCWAHSWVRFKFPLTLQQIDLTPFVALQLPSGGTSTRFRKKQKPVQSSTSECGTCMSWSMVSLDIMRHHKQTHTYSHAIQNETPRIGPYRASWTIGQWPLHRTASRPSIGLGPLPEP